MILLRLGAVAAVSFILFTASRVHGDATPGQTSPYRPIDQKLKSIVVSIDFTGATLDQAIKALATLCRQHDPDHKGIGFIIQPETAEMASPITLKLDNVPVGETLRYVCELARVHYKVDDRMVTLTPSSDDEGLVKRTFHVGPDFVRTATSAGVIPTVTP